MYLPPKGTKVIDKPSSGSDSVGIWEIVGWGKNPKLIKVKLVEAFDLGQRPFDIGEVTWMRIDEVTFQNFDSVLSEMTSAYGYPESARQVEDTALKAADGKTFGGSSPSLSADEYVKNWIRLDTGEIVRVEEWHKTTTNLGSPFRQALIRKSKVSDDGTKVQEQVWVYSPTDLRKDSLTLEEFMHIVTTEAGY